MLVAPRPKEELIMYLSASEGAVGVVLMTERDSIQTPVYFANRALQGLELSYTPMEKLVLALVFVAKRVRRSQEAKNKKADALSKIASTSFAHLSKQVLVEVLQEKSIQEYLKDRVLPDDKKEANKLRIKARQYELMDEVLYKRSFLRLWLSQGHAVQILLVNHAQGRTGCDTQGIDIVGPFPKGPGKVKFLIVTVDYFTKWIKENAVATINGSQVKKFLSDNIVCRFGLPGEIVSDNGKQFSDNPLKDWCEKLNITHRFSSVKHPLSNRLVERANKSLGEGIKACLGKGNKNLIEEIPHILWAYRTMIKSSNGDTPLSLTCGTEAVIPAKIKMPTYRTAVVDVAHNDDEIRLNLDLLEERRKRASIREAKAKSKMMKYYNARVRGVTFMPGDYVYHSNEANHTMDRGNLGQNRKDLTRSRGKDLDLRSLGDILFGYGLRLGVGKEPDTCLHGRCAHDERHCGPALTPWPSQNHLPREPLALPRPVPEPQPQHPVSFATARPHSRSLEGDLSMVEGVPEDVDSSSAFSI
ncbi:hypothetical protein Tco_0699711 [Tanacetum coccineum]|uniref:Reverse transcriptase domain-containing protein n=1 Tax=Tanacetum coccineum TaxID=301880 RepID=A0ABQ5F1G8_9ASTR